MATAYVQIISLVLAGFALILGAWLLIVGKRPWRGSGDGGPVAPRVRLLGLSYILVFGSAMIQVIAQPTGYEAEALGGFMVLGGMIVIAVVYLEARATRLASHEDRLDSRLSS
jgi:hypothetical protein